MIKGRRRLLDNINKEQGLLSYRELHTDTRYGVGRGAVSVMLPFNAKMASKIYFKRGCVWLICMGVAGVWWWGGGGGVVFNEKEKGIFKRLYSYPKFKVIWRGLYDKFIKWNVSKSGWKSIFWPDTSLPLFEWKYTIYSVFVTGKSRDLMMVDIAELQAKRHDNPPSVTPRPVADVSTHVLLTFGEENEI